MSVKERLQVAIRRAFPHGVIEVDEKEEPAPQLPLYQQPGLIGQGLGSASTNTYWTTTAAGTVTQGARLWTTGISASPSVSSGIVYGQAFDYNSAKWRLVDDDYAPTPLTDDQFIKLEEKLTLILSNGWTCPKCQAVWAPTMEFCRVCSFVERLEEDKA